MRAPCRALHFRPEWRAAALFLPCPPIPAEAPPRLGRELSRQALSAPSLATDISRCSLAIRFRRRGSYFFSTQYNQILRLWRATFRLGHPEGLMAPCG